MHWIPEKWRGKTGDTAELAKPIAINSISLLETESGRDEKKADMLKRERKKNLRHAN